MNDILHKMSNEELIRIIDKYGLFNNHHEFYGVVREEVEEVDTYIIEIFRLLDASWKCVKKDDIKSLMGFNGMLINAAADAILELVQVIAVCKKLEKGFINNG